MSNPMSGNFYFYSYRDPNVVKTLKAFDEAIKHVTRGNFDEADLEEAKIEMIQGLDAPISPGSQGEVAYSWWREGRTLEERQKFRNRLLALTREEVISSVEEVIVKNIKQGHPVVFAGRELLEKTNEELQIKGKELLFIESIYS